MRFRTTIQRQAKMAAGPRSVEHAKTPAWRRWGVDKGVATLHAGRTP